jgi:cytosine deaminase
MGLHVAQMTSQAAMNQCFEAVTTAPAQILGLDDWGIAPGKQASFVLLQATNVVEAIRLRANRLAVYRNGVKLASSPPQVMTLNLPGRPRSTTWAD